MSTISPHSFHIPVMGLAYTVDSPIKVARFGISSVISIIEDNLVEMMRRQYYGLLGEEYIPIPKYEPGHRSRRVTDYLNLVNRIIKDQVEKLKRQSFEAGTELVQYFEMLPGNSKLRQAYQLMLHCSNSMEKLDMQAFLRSQVVAGSIDVNIMTKLDRDNYDARGKRIDGDSEAVAALKGYANSDLSNSSIVFSAGLNPRLFSYMENLTSFDADINGVFQKKIIIKVSDYRSALIQGKFLAKKGLWVSEYRIESGLNCGGHAFATEGFLLGPILDEFRQKKQELYDACLSLYMEAQKQKNAGNIFTPPMPVITVQGGIGTAEEHTFLLEHYEIASNGWGTPFLLVPEATTVDEHTLQLLSGATEENLELSYNSPLGVRFQYLKDTTAHKLKMDRIMKGKPGSPCTEKHLAFNTEFTSDPICTASAKYQKLKLEQLAGLDLEEEEFERQAKQVTDKECLCVGLSNSAAISKGETMIKNRKEVTICPGPNIAYFSKIVSLKEMVDHIYGRTNIIGHTSRPHMFVKELELYVDYLAEQMGLFEHAKSTPKKTRELQSFAANLREGIAYYQKLRFMTAAYYEGIQKAEKRLNELTTGYFGNQEI